MLGFSTFFCISLKTLYKCDLPRTTVLEANILIKPTVQSIVKEAMKNTIEPKINYILP